MKKSIFLFFLTVFTLIISQGCMTKKLTPEEVAQMNRINARLPFNVAIDGKKAKPASETAAVIETPVSPTSEIVCDCMDTNLINITFMPCEKDGIVIPGKKPALILIRDSNKTTLDRTIDNKPLAPGNYLMDVTSGDKTSRIVIEIK